MTVRDRRGNTSGWAGVNHYDFAKIDPSALAERALSKARQAVNPQAVEPGRYTAILEPQATADLFSALVRTGQFERGSLGRAEAEMGMTAFSGERMGWTKISEKVLDERLTMSADPMDPDGGFIPYDSYDGTPHRSVSWINRGILRELSYDQQYALSALGDDRALPDSGSFRLAAAPGVPTVEIGDMIAKTERGVLVTRLSGVTILDNKSVLCTGYTRDGLWLIERGKISKAIKNFRFTESPLFVLNQLLDVGSSVRVYQPGRAWVAPAVRVKDFSFTALADAV
jgi:predicted Zn-dependent protease